MKIRYDEQGDVLYIEFKDCTVTTRRIDEDIAIDYDAEGHIAGIEVLSASRSAFSGKGDIPRDLKSIINTKV